MLNFALVYNLFSIIFPTGVKKRTLVSVWSYRSKLIEDLSQLIKIFQMIKSLLTSIFLILQIFFLSRLFPIALLLIPISACALYLYLKDILLFRIQFQLLFKKLNSFVMIYNRYAVGGVSNSIYFFHQFYNIQTVFRYLKIC